jgi:hypothetical protein
VLMEPHCNAIWGYIWHALLVQSVQMNIMRARAELTLRFESRLCALNVVLSFMLHARHACFMLNYPAAHSFV